MSIEINISKATIISEPKYDVASTGTPFVRMTLGTNYYNPNKRDDNNKMSSQMFTGTYWGGKLNRNHPAKALQARDKLYSVKCIMNDEPFAADRGGCFIPVKIVDFEVSELIEKEYYEDNAQQTQTRQERTAPVTPETRTQNAFDRTYRDEAPAPATPPTRRRVASDDIMDSIGERASLGI